MFELILKVLGSIFSILVLPIVINLISSIIFKANSFTPRRVKNLKGLRKILNNRISLRYSKRYIHQLELQSIPCLKGLPWKEVDVLLDEDIGVSTIACLRDLKLRKFLKIRGSHIFIPSIDYLIRYYYKSPLACSILGLFVICALILLYHVIFLDLKSFAFLVSLLSLLGFEFFVIKYFDSLIALNMIKNNNELGNSNIFFTDSFDEF